MLVQCFELMQDLFSIMQAEGSSIAESEFIFNLDLLNF